MIEFYKKVYPDRFAEAKVDREENCQSNQKNAYVPGDGSIWLYDLKAHKDCDEQSHLKSVADVHGAVKKGRFQLIPQPTA